VSDSLGADEAAQRAVLQRLDHALRGIVGIDARPYQVPQPSAGEPTAITYTGPVLTPEQEHQVRRYIEFTQHGN